MSILDNKDTIDRNVKNRENEVDSLTENIKIAGHLNESRRTLFLKLSDMFLSEFENNLFKNQFELSHDYEDVTPDEWTMFLMDNMVAKYLARHKDIFIKMSAENNLTDAYGKGKKDSINMIEKIEAKNKQESKQNIVILRVTDVKDRT